MKSYIPLHIGHFRPVDRSVIRPCGGTSLLAISVTSLHSAPTEKPTDVRRVRNHLKVRSQELIADETLAQNVKAALVRDPYVDRYAIGVSAVKGTVNLTGKVDSHHEKSQAEDVASGVSGVTAVNNSLTVGSPNFRYYSWPYSWYDNAPYHYNTRPSSWNWPNTDDAEVKSDIEERLQWSPLVNADDIKVSGNDGVATLTGKAGSQRKFNIATENAYQGGAHSVLNMLEFEYARPRNHTTY